LKKRLLIGRRENCDIVLRFANVSGQHCELIAEDGYWFVTDRASRNGTRVNGVRVTAMRKRLDPGDTLYFHSNLYVMLTSVQKIRSFTNARHKITDQVEINDHY
ncbi:MAG: hypothetical protein DSY58_09435, partial [Desulfobulbus sp.]